MKTNDVFFSLSEADLAQSVPKYGKFVVKIENNFSFDFLKMYSLEGWGGKTMQNNPVKRFLQKKIIFS